jgi:hypothetical protein
MQPGDANKLGSGVRLTTDAEGKWQFGSVPVSMNEVSVEIIHPEFMLNRRSLPRSAFGIEGEDKSAAKIPMRRGLIITGKVTGKSGKTTHIDLAPASL